MTVTYINGDAYTLIRQGFGTNLANLEPGYAFVSYDHTTPVLFVGTEISHMGFTVTRNLGELQITKWLYEEAKWCAECCRNLEATAEEDPLPWEPEYVEPGPCLDCDGTGIGNFLHTSSTLPCSYCGGTGRC